MEGLGLEQRLRGWNGNKGEGGGEGGGTFELIFPFTASSPLIFSLLSECLVPDLADVRWEKRRDTKCRQILKVAADYFKRRKYPLLLWGLPLIRLSTAGVKREHRPIYLKNTNKLCIHLGTFPLPDPLQNNLHQQPFLLHLSACITSPWFQLSCSSVQLYSCTSGCTKHFWCLI